MRGAWTILLAATLTACWPAEPAQAWGSFTHVWIAERAYGVLVAQYPWLAAHRDAFLWGAIAGDLDMAPDLSRPSRARTHAPAALEALWQEACAVEDQGARAFALGWAVHMGADDAAVDAHGASRRAAAVRDALAASGAAALPTDITPLVEWAVDAALVPKSTNTVFNLYRSTVVNAGTPAGGPLRRVLERVFHIDESAYMSLARLQATMSAGNTDHYLAERARWARIEPWADQLRSPGVRQALGNIRPDMARAVNLGVLRARAVCEPPGPKAP
jgi:hypothetical protein